MSELTWKMDRKAPAAGEAALMATTLPRFYWHVTPAAGPSWKLSIGVNQGEITPIYLAAEGGLVFAGIEQGVFVLNLATGAVVSQLTDTSYVQSIRAGADGRILISGETELMAFSAADGRLLWRAELPDAVETYEERDGAIEVRGVEGAVYRLAPATGRAVRR